MSSFESEPNGASSRKRARADDARENGHAPFADVRPPLSLSILGVEPVDEFIRDVADFVHGMIARRPEHAHGRVEVEAKVGVLRDRASGARLALPVVTEAVLHPDFECRFESNMSAMQHKHFNQMLNRLKMEPPAHSVSPIDYKHHRLVDSFYEDESSREKIRVTRDEKTGQVVECLRKIRLGDLNIYGGPKRFADWRVSVTLEVPVSHPVGSAMFTRKKDRISYSHEEFAIDLTQVTTARPHAPPEVLHELEIEIARHDFVLAAAMRRGDPSATEEERNAFDELIRAFVNNARILLRNVPPE